MGANLQESRDLATVQALINQMNQVTPYGNLTFSGPMGENGLRDPRQTTVTQSLSPQMQALFNNQVGAQQGFGNALNNLVGRGGQNSSLAGMGGQVFQPTIGAFNPSGSGQIGRVGEFQAPQMGAGAQTGGQNQFRLENMLGGQTTADAFSAERGRVEGAVFDRAMSLLEPAWAQQDRRREQDLANRGLPMSGEAYQADRATTTRGRGDTMNQLAMQAVLAGGDEQSRMLNNLMNASQTGLGQAQWQNQNQFNQALQGYGANLQGYGANLQGQGQRFGQALQGYGANLQGQQFGMNAALANRQQPLSELMTLLGASQGQQPQFMNTPMTPVQSFATSGPSAGAGIATGALGGAAAGASTGAMFGPWGAAIGGGIGAIGGGLMGYAGTR